MNNVVNVSELKPHFVIEANNRAHIVPKSLIDNLISGDVSLSESEERGNTMSGIVGIDNNNPFNIDQPPDYPRDSWFGSIGVGKASHAKFPNVDYAIRAAIRNLYRYQWLPASGKPRAETIMQIASRYAPNSENDTNSYAAFLASKLEFDLHEKIAFFDRNGRIRDVVLLKRALNAFVEIEICAGYALGDDELNRGIAVYNYSLNQKHFKLALE